MRLFEDLMEASAKIADKATKVASEAFEQTKVVAGEAVDKGKKKVNELELKNDLSKAYRQLGELYYVMRKTGEMNDALLTQYYNNAAEIEAKLEMLMQAETNENKDYTMDDTKGSFTTAAEEFAGEVKEAAKEVVSEIKEVFEDCKQDEKVKICPSCGAPAADEDVFCSECGAKLN